MYFFTLIPKKALTVTFGSRTNIQFFRLSNIMRHAQLSAELCFCTMSKSNFLIHSEARTKKINKTDYIGSGRRCQIVCTLLWGFKCEFLHVCHQFIFCEPLLLRKTPNNWMKSESVGIMGERTLQDHSKIQAIIVKRFMQALIQNCSEFSNNFHWNELNMNSMKPLATL